MLLDGEGPGVEGEAEEGLAGEDGGERAADGVAEELGDDAGHVDGGEAEEEELVQAWAGRG